MNYRDKLEELRRTLRERWDDAKPELQLAPAVQAGTEEWILLPMGMEDPGFRFFTAADTKGRAALLHALLLPLLSCSSPAEAEIWYFGDGAESAEELRMPGVRRFRREDPAGFLSALREELARRRELMASFGSRDFAAHCFRGITGVAQHRSLPRLILLIDGWESLADSLGRTGLRRLRAEAEADGLTLLAIGEGPGPVLPGLHGAVLRPLGEARFSLALSEGGEGILAVPAAEDYDAVLAALREKAERWRRMQEEAERREAQWQH